MVVTELPVLLFLEPQETCVVSVQSKGFVKEMRAQCFESMDHCQQLQKVQWVWLRQLARLESSRMVRAIVVRLLQNGGESEFGGFCKQMGGQRQAPHLQDWGRDQLCLELFEAYYSHIYPATSLECSIPIDPHLSLALLVESTFQSIYP
jgi:hypothetical protein